LMDALSPLARDGNFVVTGCVRDGAGEKFMAKKTILTEAEETIVEAAKTGAAIAKLVAIAGLAAAGPAAAGVVLESASKGLKSAEQTVENVMPSGASERPGIMPSSALTETTKRKPRAKQKKRAAGRAAAAKKRSAPKKKKTASKKTAAKKAVKRKRWTGRRKR
jgi:colicin import membrane protein